jgi:hypothetical protein
MKTIRSVSMIATIAALSILPAQAQGLQKVKAGDKITVEAVTYGAKGREVVVDSTRMLDVSMTQTDTSYTLSSELGRTTYQRNGHVVIERETSAGKTVTAENQRFNWMPPGGDWSKPYTGNLVITHPSCGLGKLSFEASAKPSKYTVQIAGQAKELDVQEVLISGKWFYGGNCGNGVQTERFVFSPDLDWILERDNKTFLGNGFLNRGSAIKTKSIN